MTITKHVLSILYAGYELGLWQKQIIKFIETFMNQKKSNIKPRSDANVDENSQQEFIKHHFINHKFKNGFQTKKMAYRFEPKHEQENCNNL